MSERDRMHRMQFYITPELYGDLALLAEQRGESMAELIRKAIQSFVLREKSPKQNVPELELIGMINRPGAPKDAASNHDRYIYAKDWER